MNSFISVLATATLLAPFQDFQRERAAILVTSAEMTRVNHGYIEAYYPEALFWHHKQQNSRQNTNGWVNGGYFSLKEAEFADTAVPAQFYGGRDTISYKMTAAELFSSMSGVPSNMIPFQSGTTTVLNEIEIAATKNVEKGYRQIAMIGGPSAMEAKAEGPVKPETLAVAHTSYILEIGSRDEIAKRHLALSKGKQGDLEAGKMLFETHYASIPLVFEVIPTSPAGEEVQDRSPGSSIAKRGWVLVVSHSQDRGKVVLPVIQADGGKIKAQSRGPLEIGTLQVRKNNGKPIGFRMSTAEFLANVVAPGTKAARGTQDIQLECVIDESFPDGTACRYETLPVVQGENQAKRKWFIDLELPGDRTEEDIAKRERNTFYVAEKTLKGVPRAYYRVNVMTDPKFVAPTSSQVMPVQERAAANKLEDLK